MAKFCGNCGTQLADDAVVCTNCGVNLAPQAQPQAPVQYQQAPQQPNYQPVADGAPTPADNAAAVIKEKTGAFVNKCKTDKKFLGIILGAVAAVVALIIVLVLVLGGGYESAIDNYIDAQLGDYDAYVDCYPEDVFEKLEKHNLTQSEKSFDKMAEMVDENDVDYDYDVEDEEKLDEDDLDDIKSYLKKNLGISKDDVTEAVQVKIKLTASANGKENSRTQKLVVVKIDGDWYVYDVLKEAAADLANYDSDDELEFDYDSDYDYDDLEDAYGDYEF